MDIKDLLHKHSDKYLEEVIRIRRHLHQYPERSFREKKTSEYIRELLKSWNISYTYPFVENGILASIDGSGGDHPVIALRSDMDALPIQEQSGLNFASVHQKTMHACGHDMHMASLLGAIRILNDMKDHFPGKVLCVFQPGEEMLPGGAKLMLEEGLFDQVRPDMIIAQHVLPEMKTGMVGFRAGPYMASSDEIYITVKGRGGHAALPHNIIDPILIASQILISLKEKINQHTAIGVPTVLAFGKVMADGAMNVIPDEVRLEGTFRTMDEKWRKDAHQLIEKITEDIASEMGGSVELDIRPGYPALKNDPELTIRSRKFAVELLGEEHVTDMDIRMTAEDFAWYAQKYPAMLYRFGVQPPGTGKVYPLHSGKFIADDRALKTGMSMLAWLAIQLLRFRK
jgi:amidohydrolase